MSLPIGRKTLCALAALTIFLGSARSGQDENRGPGELPEALRHEVGDPAAGEAVFRFETFGNEAFWTDALELPQGIAEAGLTPIQALSLGLSVDSNALNEATATALTEALDQVEAGAAPEDTALGDPAVTLSLINQNAVLGVAVFDAAGDLKPLGNGGALDLAAGDKVGVTCALCHAVTDGSVLPPTPALGVRGSVGELVDGPTNHNLDVGAILAAANNTLAYYPLLQLQFDALSDATIGRGDFEGLAAGEGAMPTEEQADAYLTGVSEESDERYYPVGTFDAFPDGVGNPTHITQFLRTDLTAPWGVDGGVEQLDDFNNTVFTVSLDPTTLLTEAGGQFLSAIAGPVGEEIQADYEAVMRQTGVLGEGEDPADVFPYIEAEDGLTPGEAASVVGLRVDEQSLLDLNAYTDGLPAPLAPEDLDEDAAERGRDVFTSAAADCTNCHRSDPNRFVNPVVVPIEQIYPGYTPTVLFPRDEPLSDIQNSNGPSPFFDDRLIVVDASLRGEPRGVAAPSLFGLASKTSLLHDDSVRGDSFVDAADQLLDPARGANAAHPVYLADAADRADVAEFLRGFTTRAPEISEGGVLNAASFEAAALAPGLILSIFGEDLGPETGAAMEFDEQGRIIGLLENTEVRIDGLPAPLLFVSRNQINAVTPFSTGAGEDAPTAEVVIRRGGQSSASQELPVVERAPALFTQDQSGRGPGAILNEDGTLNTDDNPAFAGSTIMVWGTGAGQTTPESFDGLPTEGSVEYPFETTVRIADEETDAAFSGGAPGLVAGVFQVNATVEDDVPDGEQEIVVSFDETPTQSGVTVFIANPFDEEPEL